MAHLLVNWSDDTVNDLSETDLIGALVHGIEIGRSGHHVSVHRVVEGQPTEEVYRTPEAGPMKAGPMKAGEKASASA